jgi:hypothetical protein
LSARDQRVLQVAAPVMALLLVALLLAGEWRHLARAKAACDSQRQQYEQLQLQAPTLVRWREQVGMRSLGTLSDSREIGALLSESLARYQLRGQISAVDGRWQVQIDAGDGDRILGYIAAAAGSGVRLQQASFSRVSAADKVDAELYFSAWVSAP